MAINLLDSEKMLAKIGQKFNLQIAFNELMGRLVSRQTRYEEDFERSMKMTAKLDIKNLKRKVIKVYEGYLAGKDVSKEAERIYSLTLTANPILEEKMNEAISVMSSFTNWGKGLEKETHILPVSR